mmetsp:Transcript_6112/g.18238  ORF Transcript_6112/g.18238 Transcript_6112/m.18238 type:complete len:280 (-) Transcript_6112:642-1481(-)
MTVTIQRLAFDLVVALAFEPAAVAVSAPAPAADGAPPSSLRAGACSARSRMSLFSSASAGCPPSASASGLQLRPKMLPRRSLLDAGFSAGRSPGTTASRTVSAPSATVDQPALMSRWKALGLPSAPGSADASMTPSCMSASCPAVRLASSLADLVAATAARSSAPSASSMDAESSSTVEFASPLIDSAATSRSWRFSSSLVSSLGLSTSLDVARVRDMAVRMALRFSSTRTEKSATVESARDFAAAAADSAAASSDLTVASRESAAAWSGRSKRWRRSI